MFSYMIGVFGDSHDNVAAISKAVEFFNKQKVNFVVCTGDLVSPFSVDFLKGLDADLVGVFGNNEGDKWNINRMLKDLDTEFQDFLELKLEGRDIAIYHGHNAEILDALVRSHKYDIVMSGHTHTPEITLEETTLVVNPGELCGYLTKASTVATIDLKTLEAEIHEL